MVTDSPYESGALILKPMEGILAGMVGSLAMIGVMFIWQSNSPGGFTETLSKLGGFIVPGAGVVEGVLVLLVGGGVFGILYALCEQRIPAKGLIGDGLFYGFFLWVLTGLILGAFLGEDARSIFRTWAFFVELLAFGLCLSLFSLAAKKFRSGGSALPRD